MALTKTGSHKVATTMSEVTYQRMKAQADAMGVTMAQYTTMLVAQASAQAEQMRVAMPDVLTALGAEVGRRMPMEKSGDE